MLIKPQKLQGKVAIPPSKSVSHRALICAAFASGTSTISNVILSDDILVTISGLRALGAKISYKHECADRYIITVTGPLGSVAGNSNIDCMESGSSIRFLIPIAAAVGATATFKGRGRLTARPLDIYYDIFEQKNIEYTTTNGILPLTVKGRLPAGEYQLPGNVSSQFITGLLYALSLLEQDSKIILTTPLHSVGYVDLTLQAMAEFGVNIINNNYQEFIIKGNQQYKSRKYRVEGDFSQAAFWLVAGALGNDVICTDLNKHSLQADKAIIDIITDMGGEILWLNDTSVTCKPSKTHGATIDVQDCPDIVPVLAVLAALSCGETNIINAERLRIKESDRLLAITTELTKLGADIKEVGDTLSIKGIDKFVGNAKLSAWQDHRIAMSVAIAATRSTEVNILDNPDCVSKSYPAFWQDYQALGGKIQEATL